MRLSFKDLSEYVSYFMELVEREREAQKRFHLEEINNLSPQERERRGRAILGLRMRRMGRSPTGFYLLRLFLGSEPLPRHEFQVGDWVLVTQDYKPTERSPQAQVYEIGKYYIVLAFSDRLPRFVKKKPIRIDLYVNDITFNRMKDALVFLERGRHPLVDYLLGKPKEANFSISELELGVLNFSQSGAVSLCLCSDSISIVHGPPGTGKTTTLSYYIYEEVRRGKRVLATADSNNAVDNLMEKLLSLGIKVVRVGNPIKVDEKLKKHSLDSLMREHKTYKFVLEEEKRLNFLISERNKYLRPSPSFKRGLPDKAIIELSKEGRGVRGLSVKQIRSMAKWIQINQEIKSILENIENIKDAIKWEIIKNSEVVCATNSGSALVDNNFDICVIDEATQSTEPSALIPITRAKKVVLAGDDKQLPPTVIDYNIQDKLGFSLFERWHKLYPDYSTMLLVQYRMHPKIVKFSNDNFYDSKLITADVIVNREFPYDIIELNDRRYYPVFDKENNVVFITSKRSSKEQKGRYEFSYYNDWEVRVVSDLIINLRKNGVLADDVGVISPYEAQVSLLKKVIKWDIDIKTVDGFQGREKEIIIISFVRSNEEGNIGFLRDYRRLNVALTRARTKLIMVGDVDTLRSDKLYSSLIDYVKDYGILLYL